MRRAQVLTNGSLPRTTLDVKSPGQQGQRTKLGPVTRASRRPGAVPLGHGPDRAHHARPVQKKRQRLNPARAAQPCFFLSLSPLFAAIRPSTPPPPAPWPSRG